MKNWYQSRTIWVNALAAVFLFVQKQFGLDIPEDMQLSLLALLNVWLRFDTEDAVK